MKKIMFGTHSTIPDETVHPRVKKKVILSDNL